MGLATSLVAAVAGASGFAAVAVPAISDFHLKMKEIDGLKLEIEAARAAGDVERLNEATKKLSDIQDSLTDSQKKAQMAMAGLSELYQGLSKEMEPGVLRAYGEAMIALTTIIEMAEPMIRNSVDAVNNLVDAFNRNLETEDMRAFFDYLNTNAADSLETIVKALGNFLAGMLNLFAAFGPLSVDMENGFLRMSEGFRKWTAALGENEKFQAFVDYTRKNWPLVRGIIGGAIAAIIETFAGFSGYAESWMAVTKRLIDRWREFAQGMGENKKFQSFVDYIKVNGPLVTTLIGDMLGFFVALGAALAPVGSKMVEVASAIFNFATNVLQANPLLGEMFGWFLALAGGFFTLLPLGVAIYSFFSSFITIAGIVV
ncbi:MAG: hypothetical protein LC650_03560, partial [Actinobacteria bacterium]|nr:hypothetical protein [Actinomycetota bacterium]